MNRKITVKKKGGGFRYKSASEMKRDGSGKKASTRKAVKTRKKHK